MGPTLGERDTRLRYEQTVLPRGICVRCCVDDNSKHNHSTCTFSEAKSTFDTIHTFPQNVQLWQYAQEYMDMYNTRTRPKCPRSTFRPPRKRLRQKDQDGLIIQALKHQVLRHDSQNTTFLSSCQLFACPAQYRVGGMHSMYSKVVKFCSQSISVLLYCGTVGHTVPGYVLASSQHRSRASPTSQMPHANAGVETHLSNNRTPHSTASRKSSSLYSTSDVQNVNRKEMTPCWTGEIPWISLQWQRIKQHKNEVKKRVSNQMMKRRKEKLR